MATPASWMNGPRWHRPILPSVSEGSTMPFEIVVEPISRSLKRTRNTYIAHRPEIEFFAEVERKEPVELRDSMSFPLDSLEPERFYFVDLLGRPHVFRITEDGFLEFFEAERVEE